MKDRSSQDASRAPRTDWHSLPTEEVARRLDTGPSGLLLQRDQDFQVHELGELGDVVGEGVRPGPGAGERGGAFVVIDDDDVDTAVARVRKTVGKDVQVEVLDAYEPSPVAPIGEAYDLLEQVTAEVMPDVAPTPCIVS